MAHHPCGRVPSVPGLVDPEEVDVQVEVGRQVPRRHPREAPQAALELGAQVVHVGPVCLTLVAAVPGQHVVRPLRVVDWQRPGQHSAARGLPCTRRAGLPVAADDRDGVLMDIDCDSGARLFTG